MQDLGQKNPVPVHKVYRVNDVLSPVPHSAQPSRPTSARTPEARIFALLASFPGLGDPTTVAARTFLALVGFLPVTLIAASTFGVVGLLDLARFVLVPAIVVTALVICRHRCARDLVLRAMATGVLATCAYDLIRFGFIGAGLMHHDPIPHIGVDLHLSPAWAIGYVWRYCGNGAGLSIAFFALGFDRLRQGLLFGFFVASGLIVVLVASPHAAEVLWPVNVISVSMIVSGHLAFGAGLATVGRMVKATPTPVPAVRAA